MSLATWKAEFYPIPAEAATATDAIAVEHSLAKWRGLRAEALERHGLNLTGGVLSDDERGGVFCIDIHSCALCAKHYGPYFSRCVSCSISLVREGVPCDRVGGEDIEHHPYGQFSCRDNPGPMIQCLEKAQAFVASRDGGK